MAMSVDGAADLAPGWLPFAESAALLEALRQGRVGLWRWCVDTDELSWTDNLESIHGLDEGSFDGTIASFQRDVHPEDAEAVWRSIRESLESGAPFRAVYRTAPRPDHRPLWIESRGGAATGEDGRRYLTGACTDVTARIDDQTVLRRRLAQQKAIGQLGSFALQETGFDRIMQAAVETAADVLEVPLTKILRFAGAADHLELVAGIGWDPGLVGQASVGVEQASQAGYTLTCGAPVVVADLLAETRFSGPPLLLDHGVRSGMSVVIPGSETRPFGVFGVHARELRPFDQADVDFLVALANIVANAAREDAARGQAELLVRELMHRAGNMLQLVSTIANQTFSEGLEPDRLAAARRSFVERLGSLSKANYLIAKGGWTSTQFVALARETLQPFGDQIEFVGRDIMLPPDVCFDLGLILHELATNSAKYGTLRDGGRMVLRWSLAEQDAGERVFRCAWEDADADPTGASVPGGGFGSRLLSALIERKWRGEIQVETMPGYRFTFALTVPQPG
jgi:two-component sensor histidine kinase